MNEVRSSREAQTAFGERLELLLFYLQGTQRFGINVLKVKEVIPCPRLTQVPQAHHAVRGVAHLRGEPLTVIDLARAVGRPPIETGGKEGLGAVIVTEFNRTMQGFLVNRVDRIAVCDWQQVLSPPRGTGLGSYITGVTRIHDALVQILDVEKIRGEIVHMGEVGKINLGQEAEAIRGKRAMVVDDSSLARQQTALTLDQCGIEYLMARDGREALELLQHSNMSDPTQRIDMVISDIEMPEMDGYTLTREMRGDAELKGIYVLLHTSLNGEINTAKAEDAGADAVLTKFVPEELAKAVIEGLKPA